MTDVEPAIAATESHSGQESPIIETPFLTDPEPAAGEACEQSAPALADPTADSPESPAQGSEPAGMPPAGITESSVAPPVRSLRSIIEAELLALQGYHRRVIDSGEVEAIHKMRVITRKLQSAIDLLQFKPDQLKIKGLKRTLRRWRRSLSRVRNYDVFLMIVEKETLARRPGGRRPYELMGTELEKRRIKSLQKARSELRQIKIQDLAAKLGIELKPGDQEVVGQAAPPRSPAATCDAPLVLIDDEARIAARAFDRLRQRLAEFQAKALSTHASDKLARVHQLRIAAKRLRYLIEALSQMGYGDAARAVEWLKATQDRLGDLHDIEAFGEEIVRVAARPRFVRKHMAEAGEMLQAASRFLARRESLRSRLLPVRVPPVLGAASSRLTRSVSAGSIPRDTETPANRIPG